MSVSLGNIAKQVNAKIVAGGQNPIDTARLVGSVEALETRYSVANLADLPTAALNAGRFIYVEDIAAYRYSDGTQWTNDYDTTTSVTEGQLFSWGGSFSSVPTLGDGTTNCSCSPVREFYSATDWSQVSATNYLTSALKTSGEIWSWGSNACGALGDGTLTTRSSPVREICSDTNWCSVSLGFCHNSAIKTSGELWTWGGNSSGVIGDGTTIRRCSPVREFCSAINWCKVSAGFDHSNAIKTSGELWVWGNNDCGALGDGTTVNKCSPVREFCSATDWCTVSSGGLRNTSAIKTSGELWSWGRNDVGQLADGTVVQQCSPVREITSSSDWFHVGLGGLRSHAIKGTKKGFNEP
jgi:alpha-tubulin suppressor-like RCC1 family protein